MSVHTPSTTSFLVQRAIELLRKPTTTYLPLFARVVIWEALLDISTLARSKNDVVVPTGELASAKPAPSKPASPQAAVVPNATQITCIADFIKANGVDATEVEEMLSGLKNCARNRPKRAQRISLIAFFEKWQTCFTEPDPPSKATTSDAPLGCSPIDLLVGDMNDLSDAQSNNCATDGAVTIAYELLEKMFVANFPFPRACSDDDQGITLRWLPLQASVTIEHDGHLLVTMLRKPLYAQMFPPTKALEDDDDPVTIVLDELFKQLNLMGGST